MSSKKRKFSERTDVQSILFLLLISSMLTFILPFFLFFYYISDIFVVIGMIVGSYVVLKKEINFKDRINHLLRLTFIGGILTGIDLTSILVLIARSESKVFDALTFFLLLTFYIILTQLIIVVAIIGYLYLYEKNNYIQP